MEECGLESRLWICRGSERTYRSGRSKACQRGKFLRMSGGLEKQGESRKGWFWKESRRHEVWKR